MATKQNKWFVFDRGLNNSRRTAKTFVTTSTHNLFSYVSEATSSGGRCHSVDHSDQISGDRIDFDDGTFPQIGKDNANVKLQQVKVKRKLTLRRCCSPIPQRLQVSARIDSCQQLRHEPCARFMAGAELARRLAPPDDIIALSSASQVKAADGQRGEI
ncbi:hypothetical protein F2P81_009901 [Scophthalmus maximus]|uniref:Uncharacterized protein n=1 Tax=Scophthalmus maximus TaxID=52904 RepID=A0A6A4SU92_SCOMX|nr:hypothetical protein F2P81_009901 [Scophthalmus maximus]